MPSRDENEHAVENIQELAEEITRYLLDHEGVADTLEGVTQWWLLRQRLQEERNRVEQAMMYLCQKGLVEARRLPDGEILYSAAPLKKNTLN